jgi:hypothetical protein
MNQTEFEFFVNLQRIFGVHASRLEGRLNGSIFEYRVRSGYVAEGSPNFVYGQSCSTVLSAIQSATADTPLVSLRRFADRTGNCVYQAVWSSPIQ